MARNKHSTALFDVIHAAKKPPRSSPSASIPAPRWWGKDKKPSKPAVADATENVGKQQSWLTAARRNGGVAPLVAPVVSEAQPVIESQEPVPPADVELNQSDAEVAVQSEPAVPKTRFLDRFKSRAVLAETVVEESAIEVETVEPKKSPEPKESPEPVELPLPVFYSEAEPVAHKPEKLPARASDNRDAMVGFDSVTGDVRFHLSYGGIIAIGFILLMALAIAFIAGTQTKSLSAQADPPDTKQAASNTSSNAQVTGSSTAGLALAVSPSKSDAADPDPSVMPEVLSVSPKSPRTPAALSPPPAVKPAPLAIKATRDIGMIYVVIQSYPDQDLAQKACDFVNHAGVPCTLVQGLSGWAMKDWYSVVGLQPFNKHDPGLEEYERAVTAMGLKFSNKIYNQFQPQGYTWRADSDQGEP